MDRPLRHLQRHLQDVEGICHAFFVKGSISNHTFVCGCYTTDIKGSLYHIDVG